MKNLANSSIQSMKYYNPPLDNRRAYEGLLLDFNERTIPPDKKVTQAIKDFIDEKKLQIYPEYFDITQKIAAYAGVKSENIIVTNGSDQGIELIWRTFTTANDTVIIPSPSFALFDQCAGVIGNKIIKPAYTKSQGYPLEEVLAAINNEVKLIVICNPNNPTGTLVNISDVKIIAAKAKNAIVYIDEAYYEFSQTSAVSLIDRYPNIIITRTFSKAYGFPSLRLGYTIADPVYIKEMLKVRGPYDTNMIAATAADAALADPSYVTDYAEEVMTKAKPLVETFFDRYQIPYWPSQANFLLFQPANAQTFDLLKSNGILTRSRQGPNIDNTIRVTVGTVEQMRQFIDIYKAKILKVVKYAFLDRDGALIYEPPDTFQIDSLDKLKILPDVIESLQKLVNDDYQLIMISNQDGLGTDSFPQKDFETPHNEMLKIFKKNGVEFNQIFICPHFKKDNCDCRKPKIGLVKNWLKIANIDYENSFMYGDRDTDMQFAKNIGIRGIKAKTNASCTIFNYPS